MSRRWLIAVSVIAHLAIGVGLFVSGVWRIDRLHADPLRSELVMSPPAPAPSGGPVAAKTPEIKPKEPKHVPKQPVQPVSKPADGKPTDPPPGENPDPGNGSGTTPMIGQCLENCAPSEPAPAVCGNGSTDVGEQCDDGNTTNDDGCSSTCRTEVAPRPLPLRPTVVTANVLQGLRVSGETQVHPSTATQNQMIRDSVASVHGVILVCIAPDGSVTSATMRVSTKYAAYDAMILSAARAWRYQPYLLNGAPVPACSTVSFNYAIN